MAMQYVNANGALLMAITERQELKVKATKGWRLTNRGRFVVALLALIAVATITKTEITRRITVIEDYVFMVFVSEDGSVTFSRKYGSAIEAVRAYESFKDFGFAKYEREIVLVEADGQIHSKRFVGPMGVLPVK